MEYFISDLHLGHENVISFDNRPFENIEENDATIIDNWNDVVNIDDDIYVLGDLGFIQPSKMIKILECLNGNKHLIIGNHDKRYLKNRELRGLFVETTHYKEIERDGVGIVLSHYPISCYNHHYHGWYHLYGHVHKSMEWNMMEATKRQIEALFEKECKMYNVGCMMPYMGYKPRTLKQIELGYEQWRMFEPVTSLFTNAD